MNVTGTPPGWLVDALHGAVDDLTSYPSRIEATAAVAARHGREPGACTLLNGAAEAFWLLPGVLRPRLAACVHPSFTEGERALRAAGVPLVRVGRASADWSLRPDDVPLEADLVLLGRPDNPTGVVDPVAVVEELCRPGRTIVVDEAFADLLTDDETLADRADLPGLVVLRSLTKLWGLAGLRVGYLLGPSALVARLDGARQPWPLNAPALRAAALLAAPSAREEEAARRAVVHRHRQHLVDGLRAVDGVRVWESRASYVLVRTDRADLRARLLGRGFAVRRGDTFPGLDAHHVRIAVRDEATTDRLLAALWSALHDDTC